MDDTAFLCFERKCKYRVLAINGVEDDNFADVSPYIVATRLGDAGRSAEQQNGHRGPVGTGDLRNGHRWGSQGPRVVWDVAADSEVFWGGSRVVFQGFKWDRLMGRWVFGEY